MYIVRNTPRRIIINKAIHEQLIIQHSKFKYTQRPQYSFRNGKSQNTLVNSLKQQPNMTMNDKRIADTELCKISREIGQCNVTSFTDEHIQCHSVTKSKQHYLSKFSSPCTQQ